MHRSAFLLLERLTLSLMQRHYTQSLSLSCFSTAFLRYDFDALDDIPHMDLMSADSGEPKR
jgi:hypothetical protein